MNDDTTLVTAALFGLVGFAASLTQRARRWAFEQVESADAAVSRMAAAAHDFGRYGVIVDVGGGPRRTAGRDPRSPSRACAAWCSTNQPWSLAPTPRGVEIVGGSFFESVPAGGDAYLLKSVLHHWQDEPAIEILRARRRAAGTTGTALLVIERQFALPAAKLSNLNRWTRDSTVGGLLDVVHDQGDPSTRRYRLPTEVVKIMTDAQASATSRLSSRGSTPSRTTRCAPI